MNLRNCFLSIVLILTALFAQAQDMHNAHKVVTSDTLEWKESKSLPNSKFAVIVGDPAKEGMFTMRLLLPAGLKVPPHWHLTDEHVTVLSGTMHMGMGDKLDPKMAKAVPAGGYSFMPANAHHYAWFEEESIIQITGMGPWKIVYVNPEDDPSKKAP